MTATPNMTSELWRAIAKRSVVVYDARSIEGVVLAMNFLDGQTWVTPLPETKLAQDFKRHCEELDLLDRLSALAAALHGVPYCSLRKALPPHEAQTCVQCGEECNSEFCCLNCEAAFDEMVKQASDEAAAQKFEYFGGIDAFDRAGDR